MSTEQERLERRREADAIESRLRELEQNFNVPVEDNTLAFDDELARKEQEKRERETAKQISEASFDAKQIVSSAVDLYASNNSDVDYIKSKSRQEIATLEDIMNQIRLNKEAIDNIMYVIRGGEADNNTFKAFSELQKTNIELLKMKQASLLKLEESLKQLRQDVEITNAVVVDEEDTGGEKSVKSHNARELMKTIEEAQKMVVAGGVENQTSMDFDK